MLLKTVGLGVIGLGSMGKIHFQHAHRLQGARLVAVSDLSKKALSEAREKRVKNIYSDYEGLLRNEDVDAVVIALPTHLHFQCAKSAAEAGKDIFLEKPLARNVEEAKNLVSVVQKSSVKLMVGYPLMFNQTFRAMKEKIRNGELGDVEIAYATNIGPGPFASRVDTHLPMPVPEWWFSRELAGGGVLMDLGCHMISLLRWYFGDIRQATSRLEHRFNLDIEDGALCFIKFLSGTRAIINVGWFSQAYLLRVELSGTVSHVVAQDAPSNPFSSMLYHLTRGTSRFMWSYYVELQYFVDCLIQDQHPLSSAEDGLKDIEAISLAYKNQAF